MGDFSKISADPVRLQQELDKRQAIVSQYDRGRAPQGFGPNQYQRFITDINELKTLMAQFSYPGASVVVGNNPQSDSVMVVQQKDNTGYADAARVVTEQKVTEQRSSPAYNNQGIPNFNNSGAFSPAYSSGIANFSVGNAAGVGVSFRPQSFDIGGVSTSGAIFGGSMQETSKVPVNVSGLGPTFESLGSPLLMPSSVIGDRSIFGRFVQSQREAEFKLYKESLGENNGLGKFNYATGSFFSGSVITPASFLVKGVTEPGAAARDVVAFGGMLISNPGGVVSSTVDSALSNPFKFAGEAYGFGKVFEAGAGVTRPLRNVVSDSVNPFSVKFVNVEATELGRTLPSGFVQKGVIPGVGESVFKNIPSQLASPTENLILGGTRQNIVSVSSMNPFRFDPVRGWSGFSVKVTEGAGESRLAVGGIERGMFFSPTERGTGLTQGYTYYGGLRGGVYDYQGVRFSLFGGSPRAFIEQGARVSEAPGSLWGVARGGASLGTKRFIAEELNVPGAIQPGVAATFGTRAEREVVAGVGTEFERAPTSVRGKLGNYFGRFGKGDYYVRLPSGEKVDVFLMKRSNPVFIGGKKAFASEGGFAKISSESLSSRVVSPGVVSYVGLFSAGRSSARVSGGYSSKMYSDSSVSGSFSNSFVSSRVSGGSSVSNIFSGFGGSVSGRLSGFSGGSSGRSVSGSSGFSGFSGSVSGKSSGFSSLVPMGFSPPPSKSGNFSTGSIGDFFNTGKSSRSDRVYRSKYVPSLQAEFFQIRGKRPSQLGVASGVSFRPIVR